MISDDRDAEEDIDTGRFETPPPVDWVAVVLVLLLAAIITALSVHGLVGLP